MRRGARKFDADRVRSFVRSSKGLLLPLRIIKDGVSDFGVLDFDFTVLVVSVACARSSFEEVEELSFGFREGH